MVKTIPTAPLQPTPPDSGGPQRPPAVFYVDPNEINRIFSPLVHKLGQVALGKQRVIELEVTSPSTDAWEVSGLVLADNGRVMSVRASLESDGRVGVAFFESECSCAAKIPCQHAAALILKANFATLRTPGARDLLVRILTGATETSAAHGAQNQPKAPAPSTAEVAQRRELARAQAAQRTAQTNFNQWLDLFPPAPSPAEASTPAARQGPAPDHVVYPLIVAQLAEGPCLRVGFGRAHRAPSGKWTKLKLGVDLTDPANSPESVQALRLISSLHNFDAHWERRRYDSSVDGAAGHLAISLAAQTGFLLSTTPDGLLGEPVRWCAAREVQWSWLAVNKSELAQPHWQLLAQLATGSKDSMVCHNDPPLFYDAQALECGPIEVPGLSTANLQRLLRAPPIAESAFESHSAQLLRHLAGLPLPPAITPPEELPRSRPRARLHIAAVPVASRAQLGLLSAALLFDYNGVAIFQRTEDSPVLIERSALTPGATRPEVGQALAAGLGAELGAELGSGLAAGGPTAKPPSKQVLLHRDLGAEHGALDALHRLGLAGNVHGEFTLALAALSASAGETPALQTTAQRRAAALRLAHMSNTQWLNWLDDDFAQLRAQGFKVTVQADLASWIERAQSLEVDLAAHGGGHSATDQDGALPAEDSTQSPWFDLSLGIQIGGQRRNILPFLPELLSQLTVTRTLHGDELGEPNPTGLAAVTTTLTMPEFVYLDQSNGSFLRLPTEPLKPWITALMDLLDERGNLAGESVRLSRMEALRLGSNLGAGTHWRGADALRNMVAQLAGASALPVVPLPAGLNAELRPYQHLGLNWLQFLRTHGLGGILADDMGLGKTLQTLAHILVEKQSGRLDRPALVIAPVSLMGNWRREAERFTPALKTLVLHGSQRHEAAVGMTEADLVIAPYSLLQRDRERWMSQGWHLVVLDEAQNIKNANTHAAKVVRELDTRHRLCLSGTPMENHLGELWSLFHFLMPGFLGGQTRFRQRFRIPIEKLGSHTHLVQLRARITPFMLRRAKSDVATDLPPKQVSIAAVELEGAQADLYETIRLGTEKAVRAALGNHGLARSQIEILDALLKLRQVCCDPRLVPLASAKAIKQSAKLTHLMELLPQMIAEGRRILLFSQFTSMLELIEDALRTQGLAWVKLTGQSQHRDDIIERFTSGAVPLFLISLKAGGVGLNLPQADTVIHYDPWWNPAAENQATDRAHRIGQTQSVFVYKLVAQGTIEERILALQDRKAALASSIYSDSQARREPLFTEDDLTELLKPLTR